MCGVAELDGLKPSRIPGEIRGGDFEAVNSVDGAVGFEGIKGEGELCYAVVGAGGGNGGIGKIEELDSGGVKINPTEIVLEGDGDAVEPLNLRPCHDLCICPEGERRQLWG